jgi:hypothetical protein
MVVTPQTRREAAMTELILPAPIAAYFAADMRNGEATERYFTKEAVVTDEGRTHSGHAAIAAWKLDASTKYSYTSEPVGLEETSSGYVVTSRVTGNFPGSPVDLRYAFRLERGKIAFLEIAP